MSTLSLNDLRFLYYGGGTEAERQFLEDAYAAGISADDVLGVVIGGGGGGGGTPLAVKDEGTSLTIAATSLNFKGSNIQATNVGAAVDVTVVGDAPGSAAAAQAAAIQRANHTGTQLAATVSDFNTQVNTQAKLIPLNQFAVPTAAVAMNLQTITGLGDATAALHALNRQVGDARYDASGLASAAQAAAIQRVNHTGTQLSSTISDLAAVRVPSSPVGEITATDTQTAISQLDAKTTAAGWIDRLQIGADLYDEFASAETIASPGNAGLLNWTVPANVATVPAYAPSAAVTGVGILNHQVTLVNSFSNMSLVAGLMELNPVFTAEWRVAIANLNDGTNNIQAMLGLHNDIPRQVTDLATTNANATVTSATAIFVGNDVGKVIITPNLPAGTTILSITNGTTVVVSANATATGSSQTAQIVDPTIGYWFKYSSAFTTWRAVVANLGTNVTEVDTGVTATAGAPYARLRIRSDGGGNIFFYINGTLCSNMPINTNLPGAGNRYTPALSVRKTLGSTLRLFRVDYFACRYEKVR